MILKVVGALGAILLGIIVIAAMLALILTVAIVIVSWKKVMKQWKEMD